MNEEGLVILTADPVYTTVSFSPDMHSRHTSQIIAILKERLRARPTNYVHMSSYRSKHWDGYISLIKNNKFPTGLLKLAVETLKKNAEEYEFHIKVRKYIPHSQPIYMLTKEFLYNMTLRDYQIDAAKEMIKATRGVAQIATNGGKTAIISAICRLLNSKCLIMTHKKELLYQIAGVIHTTSGLDVGLVGDGHRDLSKTVTVAMVQTMHSMLNSEEFKEFAEEVYCLIVDEAHHTSARQMYETVMSIPACYRFGLSGTPLRHNELYDLQLIGATGDVLVQISNEELIGQGISAKPEIIVYKCVDYTQAEERYHDAYEQAIVNSTLRNTIVAREAVEASRRGSVVLVLVERINHQEVLEEIITKQFSCHNLIIMNGSQSTEYRSEKLNNMRNDIAGVYCATTQLLGEGIDAPSIDVLIIAGGGKSHIKLLQQLGRGMRKKSGENKVRVVDFKDVGNRYLAKHSKERIKIYESEGFEITELET